MNLLIGTVRAVLKEHHGGEIPKDTDNILELDHVKLGTNATILTDSDLEALLVAAREPTKSPRWCAREDLDVAMLWPPITTSAIDPICRSAYANKPPVCWISPTMWWGS